MEIKFKIVKIIKHTLKNSLNVKFLRKRAVLLTFWHFPLSTCEGVYFLKVKSESVLVLRKAVKRKFYIMYKCKNCSCLCLKKFSTKNLFKVENIINCEILA